MADDKDTRFAGLRALPIPVVLELLRLYVKRDDSYQPKDAQAQRLYVSLESGEVLELLVTGEKWYDTRAMQGGGGAIDLVMHLYGETFAQAVKRLEGLQAMQGKAVVERQPAKAAKASKVGRKATAKAGDDGDKHCAKEGQCSRHIVPVRKVQGEYFVADILDWIPKDDTTSMEHPLFALKAGDKRVRVYERNGCKVTIKPGHDGCATIHDKDLWIYCISLLVAAKKQGREIGRTVRFRMVDFMRATNRDTSGRAYLRAADMLERLAGTRIETNIVTPGYRGRKYFGLVDSAEVVERDSDNRMVSLKVTLPDWLFCSVDAMQVLTLSRDYFRLRKPIDRRIYELARKHCGQQEVWRVSMATLHEKSGSSAVIKNFRIDVRALADSGELPDYLMTYDKATDMVTFSVPQSVDK